jgi:hypothetical protein
MEDELPQTGPGRAIPQPSSNACQEDLSMAEMLREYVDSRGLNVQVDRRPAVIRGVKILGLASRNGRTYLPEALEKAAPLYEGAKVNVNHPKGSPNAPRDYQDRIGVIRNVIVRPGEGLFGDLHFNPKHALAEQLIWDAEHLPENVGFSHNVEARTRRDGDQVVVEAILRVQSVDLVADPATTRGLFESADAAAERPFVDQLTLDGLKRQRPDLVEALAKENAAERSRLEEELERLRTAEAMRSKRQRVDELLREHQLPFPEQAHGWAKLLVNPAFLQSLLDSPDEPAMRRLVEERAALIRRLAILAPAEPPDWSRPLSRDQVALAGAAPLDAKAFVEAIT